MSYNETWISGEWAAICDRCGFKFKSSELRRQWNGRMVCKDDFDLQHPQELLRTTPEKVDVPFTAPETTDTHITVTFADMGADNVKPTGTFDNSI